MCCVYVYILVYMALLNNAVYVSTMHCMVHIPHGCVTVMLCSIVLMGPCSTEGTKQPDNA